METQADTAAFTAIREALDETNEAFGRITALIRVAWEQHRGSGTKAWKSACDEHLGESRKRLNSSLRKAIVRELKSDTDMSNVVLASVLGMDEKQVRRWSATSDIVRSDEVTDANGRTINTTNIGKSRKVNTANEEEVQAAFADIATAEQSAELENLRAENKALALRAESAEKELAALKRVQALEGELNEIRLAAAMLRARARRGDDVADLADNLVNRIDSVMDKGENKE